MKLLLLGTAGYYPSEGRHTHCMMLPELGVLLDAGTGMFRVRRHLVTPTLDVFLTHAHLDHIVGLTYLFGVLHERNVEAVRVHADAAKLSAIREHLFHPTLFPAMPPITWVPLSGPVNVGRGATVRNFVVDHPGGAVAYRIDHAGGSLAYVTDTSARVDAPYVRHIRGVDVLIHECYFPDGSEDAAAFTGHSCLTPVLEVAAEAGAGQLILVHINPLSEQDPPLDLARARTLFPRTRIGFDGMEIEF